MRNWLATSTISHLVGWLSLLIILVYSPSFFNTFIWDDEQFIVKNVYTTSFVYLPQIFTTNTIAGAGQTSNYYRPLTTLSFLIDRTIWGLRPFGFHLTNVGLHIAVSVAFFLLLRRITGSQVQSWLVALVYSLHPLHTEAVTYINSRGDSLFAVWLLVGVLAFDKAILLENLKVHWRGQTYTVGPRWLALFSCLAFSLSILAKEIAVAGWGLFFLVALVRQFQNRHVAKKLLVSTLFAFSLMVMTYLGLRLSILNFENSLNFYQFESTYTQHLHVRLLTFCRVLVQYLQLLVLPYPLHMEREVDIVTSPWSLWPWLVVLVSFLWLGSAWWEWKKRRQLLIGLGGLWFLGMLVPVSGIIPINGMLYEHWLYVPLMGVGCLMVGLWRLIRARVSLRWVERFWLIVVVIFATLTIRQNWIWRHPIPFYTYTLQFAETARLNNNLGMAYAEAGDQKRAISFYQKALGQSNLYPQIYYNLARSYREIGDFDAAVEHALLALDRDPAFLYASSLLAEIYLQQLKYEQALPVLEKLHQQLPADIQLGLIYGQVLYLTGNEVAADQVWSQTYQQSGLDFSFKQAVLNFKQATHQAANQ